MTSDKLRPIKATASHIEEVDLIRQLKSGEAIAFEYLYLNYSAAIYGTVFRIVKHQGLAEEVLNDVFLRYLDKIHTYIPEKGRLFTWMLNIARNLAIDRLRSREIIEEKKTNRVSDYVYFERQGRSVETFVEGIGVPELLQRLPEEQRFVVYNLYFNGYSQSELSEEFNIPLGTVKTRLRLGMQELRNILKLR